MLFTVTGVPRQVLISLSLYIGQMITGLTLSWTGAIFPKLQDPNDSPLQVLPSGSELSLIASLIYVGGIPGPPIMGWLSNIKGRKPCLMIAGVIMSLAYLLLMFSRNLAMLYCGRIMSGFGMGIIGVMNVVYMGEIASTNIRGMLLTALGIFITIGAILMYSVGYFLSYVAATSVGLGLSIALTLSVLLIPESPIFYILKGKDELVEDVLRELGREKDLDDLKASKESFQNTTSTKDWIELFKIKSNRKALIIVILINIFQHCSGIITIITFSSIIFDMAGSSINSYISMITISCFQLIGSGLVTIFIERYGRKTLLLISCAMTSLSMLILGVYFYYEYMNYSGINDVKWLPLVILIVFCIGYDVGLGIIPNTLTGEMFTTNVRSKGSAVVMSTTWVTGFAITTMFGAILDVAGGHVAFWFFSCSSACAFLFTLFFIPETKGKTLLAIQELIEK